MKKLNKKIVLMAILVAGAFSLSYSKSAFACDEKVSVESNSQTNLNQFVENANGNLFGADLLVDGKINKDILNKYSNVDFSEPTEDFSKKDFYTMCFVDTEDGDYLGQAIFNIFSNRTEEDGDKSNNKKENKSIFEDVEDVRLEFYEIKPDMTIGNLVNTSHAVNSRGADVRKFDKKQCNSCKINKFQLKFGEDHPYLVKCVDNSNNNFLAYFAWVAGKPKKSDNPAEFKFEDGAVLSQNYPNMNLYDGKTNQPLSDRMNISIVRDADKISTQFTVIGCKNNPDSVITKIKSNVATFDYKDENGNVLYSEKVAVNKDLDSKIAQGYSLMLQGYSSSLDSTNTNMFPDVQKIEKQLNDEKEQEKKVMKEQEKDEEKKAMKEKKIEEQYGKILGLVNYYKLKENIKPKFDSTKVTSIAIRDGDNKEVLAYFNFNIDDKNVNFNFEREAINSIKATAVREIR